MAFSFLPTTPISSFNGVRHPSLVPQRLSSTKIHTHKLVQCVSSSMSKLKSDSETVVRRSANYQPCIWDDVYVQSLDNLYKDEVYMHRAEKLKKDVKDLIGVVSEPIDQLELIDTLQRLGLSYLFEVEIKKMLQEIHDNVNYQWKNDDLYGTALKFRLFRQHGFLISEEVFNNFMDKSESFQACISEDVKGMLSLYEASYHGFEGENIMEEACQFTTQHLQNLKPDSINTNLALEVKHALELPLHLRVDRLEARWFIDHYQNKDNFNPTLLELAKLDFNILQGLHREELKEAFRWWKKSDLGDPKLGFARDSLVISYAWTVGIAFQPQYSYWRILCAKINNLITYIDDIYDIYGTPDELQSFADIVDRWDIMAIKKLPNYMRIMCFALYNVVNEMAYEILTKQETDVWLNIKNSWTKLLQTYLVEANWFQSGYKPTTEEYMENALVSISTPLMLVNHYMGHANPVNQQELHYLETNPEIFICLSKISRLLNDLANSSDELKRGDIPKSVQCVMNDSGVSEEVARQHIKDMIRQLWQKINKYEAEESVLSETTMKFMLNLVKMFHCVYLHGDGHAVQKNTKTVAVPLLFEPIPM